MSEVKHIGLVKWIGWIDLIMILCSAILLGGLKLSNYRPVSFRHHRDARMEFGNLMLILAIILLIKFVAAVALIYGASVGNKHPIRTFSSGLFWSVIAIFYLILCCGSFHWISYYPYLIIGVVVSVVVYLVFVLVVGLLLGGLLFGRDRGKQELSGITLKPLVTI